MYHCVNCGTEVDELYRRYSPNVLKLLKCEACGFLADKYIEYDSVIILVDLILLEKRAYRHLLYNCDLKSWWKLVIILWLVESFRNISLCNTDEKYVYNWKPLQYNFGGHCNLYLMLFKTAIALTSFVVVVILCTIIKWSICSNDSNGCSVTHLAKALVIGGCGKLLGLLEITWGHIFLTPHYFLVSGYTLLCLLTAYSVITNSGKLESSFVLGMGILVHNFASSLSSVAFEVLELV